MIWAKRQFSFDEYGPYQMKIAELHMKLPDASGFMMVGREVDGAIGLQDVFMALPNEALLRVFDGFELVEETQLPKAIDSIIYVDSGRDDFEKWFSIRA